VWPNGINQCSLNCIILHVMSMVSMKMFEDLIILNIMHCYYLTLSECCLNHIVPKLIK
jgi:hypothetical protein